MKPIQGKACIGLRLAAAMAVLLALFTETAIADTRDPQNEILFIFNHGSSAAEYFDCYLPLIQPPPGWVRKMAGSRVGHMKIRVETPCTGWVSGNFPTRRGCGALTVCRRANRIVKAIRKARERGYPAKHIFVGGHSAGGWASLLIKKWNPGLFNGVIATATAFLGKRRSRLCSNKGCQRGSRNQIDRYWKSKMRKKHNIRLGLDAGKPAQLRALITAFQCDPFGWPDEYPFPVGSSGSTNLGVFPPQLWNGKNAPCARSQPRKHANGCKTRRCVSFKDIPEKKGPLCGSGKEGGSFYGQMLNCPKGFEKLCKLNQHTQVHNSTEFEDYLFTERKVLDFIKTSIRHWPGTIDRADYESPCGFITYPEGCPAPVY